MDSYTAKQAIRQEMASRKKQYDPHWFSENSDTILYMLETTDAFRRADCIALYNALPDEVQTSPLHIRWAKRKTLLLPVTQADNIFFRPYTGDDNLQRGAFGIYEPLRGMVVPKERIELVVAPGVAFDRQGHRLGRGKGYYDRFLAGLPAVKIGLCFGFQLLDLLPVEPSDVSMDRVITEEEIIINE